jgi:hypothetical protein
MWRQHLLDAWNRTVRGKPAFFRQDCGENGVELGRTSILLTGMKYLIAIALVAVGVYVIYLGNRRADSVAGIAERTGNDIANAFDGKTRQAQHMYYYIGGGALILTGAFVAWRKSPL